MGYSYKWCSILQLCRSILAQPEATDKTYAVHVRPSPRLQVPVWEQHARVCIVSPGVPSNRQRQCRRRHLPNPPLDGHT